MLTKEQATERAKQWAKSKMLGRCVCSTPIKPFPCNCPYFIDTGICHCAGEEMDISVEEWAKYNIEKAWRDKTQ